MFIPKPNGSPPPSRAPRVIRTVTRSAIVQPRVPPHKNITNKPGNNVRRINPPNTVQQKPINSVKVVERKKQHNVQKSKGVVQTALRQEHTNLVTSYIGKVNGLRGIGVGRVLVMVACGPSISEIPLEELKGHPKIDIMSINKPDQRIWPTTYWAFCDQTQYKRNEALFDKYEGIIINSASIRARHRKQILIRNRSGTGFSLDLSQGYYVGRSTTYANMQTALWMNYDRIYILGMDMTAVEKDGKKILHYYGQNPDIANKNREERFKEESRSYEFASGYLQEADKKKFYICSTYNPWGFTSKFNKMPHEGITNEIINYANTISQT